MLRAEPNKVEPIAFILLLALVTGAFLFVIWEYTLAIFWAVVLALLFRPVHRWLFRRLGNRPSLNALLATLAVVTTAVVPLGLVAWAVIQEATTLVADLQGGTISPQEIWAWLLEQLPFLPEWLERLDIDPAEVEENLSSAAVTVSQWVAGHAVTVGQNTLRLLVHIFVMLYLLFFLFRNGRGMLDAIARVLPIELGLQRRLATRFVKVTQATVRGTFLIAALQGLIGGLTFWALGLRAALLWGVVMALLALIPAAGPALVWVPAVLVLAFAGYWIKALILLLIGVLIIGLVDNVLRPTWVGHDAKLPDYIILVTMLGGIAAFGLSGLLIGPIIGALFFAVWLSFGTRHRRQTVIP